MHVSNEESPPDSGWNGLIRLQSEYQARLTEETLRFLRGVQATFSPRAPGTVVRVDGVRLDAEAGPGEQAELALTVENRQRVHTAVAPAMSPMTTDDGWTWYPEAKTDPAALLLAPGETVTVRVSLSLPGDLPAATFRGSLALQGFLREPVPVRIVVRPVEEAR